MNGLDILAIVAVFVLFYIGARKLDEHERWLERQELREETWRKIDALNGVEYVEGEVIE